MLTNDEGGNLVFGSINIPSLALS